MPHTRSAKKSLRKSDKRRLRNRAAKKAIRVQIKEIEALAKDGSLDELKLAYNLAAKKLDKAAAHKVVHPNFAGRKKSQLSKLIQSRAGSRQGNRS
jgi:small subunit ribosomal protein S20